MRIIRQQHTHLCHSDRRLEGFCCSRVEEPRLDPNPFDHQLLERELDQICTLSRYLATQAFHLNFSVIACCNDCAAAGSP